MVTAYNIPFSAFLDLSKFLSLILATRSVFLLGSSSWRSLYFSSSYIFFYIYFLRSLACSFSSEDSLARLGIALTHSLLAPDKVYGASSIPCARHETSPSSSVLLLLFLLHLVRSCTDAPVYASSPSIIFPCWQPVGLSGCCSRISRSQATMRRKKRRSRRRKTRRVSEPTRRIPGIYQPPRPMESLRRRERRRSPVCVRWDWPPHVTFRFFFFFFFYNFFSFLLHISLYLYLFFFVLLSSQAEAALKTSRKRG